jgi:hypothetical protein
VALATYSDLQTAIANELLRSDLTAYIPDFITRFEGLARRKLRTWLRTTITATNVAGDYLVTGTVSEVVSASYNDGASGAHNFPIDLISKEVYQGLLESDPNTSSVAGQAAYPDADIDAGTLTLRFWPPAGSTSAIAHLSLEVIRSLQALGAAQPTNALLREAPDLYLKGSCAEAESFLELDERVAIWQRDRDEAFRELRAQTNRRLYGGSPRRKNLTRVFG